MSREAMKLALEKIANALPAYIDGVAAREYLTVIHKALAEQPTQQGHSCYCPNCEALSKELAELQAQKPIAWRVKWPAIGGGYKWMMVDSPLMEKEGFVNEALYGKAQALAEQPAQQEPVARVFNKSISWRPCDIAGLPAGTPLYTFPPAQRKPLTDEEIGECIDKVNTTSQYSHHHFGWHLQFARAIEAAHGIGEKK